MDDFEKATTFDALYKALRACRQGVMWKDSTARYAADALKETYKLRREILDGTYRIRPYTHFIVTDPKRREVMATNIRDRQYQRALCDSYLYEQITHGFIRDNFACQKGRGVDDALDRMDAHLHRYYRHHGAAGWVLKCDIRSYFASTSHEVAKAAVAKRVPDERVCRAVYDIIDSFGETGIGLGSQISQLIELAVLDDLDHYIKEKLQVRHYLRYMDDFILIHQDREYLAHCLEQIRSKLSGIGLELNDKTALFPLSHGIKWLQWRFLLTETGKVIRRMGRKNITRERRRLNNMHRKGLPRTVAEESLRSWKAGAERGNTRGAVIRMKTYLDALYPE